MVSDSPAPQCTHSSVRIFPNNVLPWPVVHQQNSRTTHGMNQPPPRTTHFLFDTNANPFNSLSLAKHGALAVSVRYKFGLSPRSLFHTFFARPATSRQSPLVTHHSPLVASSSSLAAHHFLNQSLAKRNRKPAQLIENNHQGPKSMASFCRLFDPRRALPHRISQITTHYSPLTPPSHDHSS